MNANKRKSKTLLSSVCIHFAALSPICAHLRGFAACLFFAVVQIFISLSPLYLLIPLSGFSKIDDAGE